MNIKNNSGKVMTVLGPINPNELGNTSTHDHIIIDFEAILNEPLNKSEIHMMDEMISIENLGWVRFNWSSSKDNLNYTDINLACSELNHFKEAGGKTIVDVTNIGLGRSPEKLKKISNKTGINIVMGAGFYVELAQTKGYTKDGVEFLYETIINDINLGVGETQIKSGIIGEVGCSWPWTDNEKLSMQASVLAHKNSGLPLLIHPGRNQYAPLEIIKYIDDLGANLENVVLGHIDRTIFDFEILKETAETGVFLNLDLWGHDSPFYPLAPDAYMPGDHERIKMVEFLIDQGFEDSILLAHDICTKHRLKKYGGHGFDHLLNRVVPWMKNRNIEDVIINKMMIKNPQKMLTIK
jgi:phosphotriesterase-related protein